MLHTATTATTTAATISTSTITNTSTSTTTTTATTTTTTTILQKRLLEVPQKHHGSSFTSAHRDHHRHLANITL